MNPLAYEFVNYFVAVTSGGISFAIAVLFYMANRRHKTQHTLFRALGFAFIGEAFGFHLFGGSYSELSTVGYIFELLGLLFLYYSLLLNNEEGQVFFSEIVFENRPKPLKKLSEFIRFVATALVVCISFVLIARLISEEAEMGIPAIALLISIISFKIALLKYSEYKNGIANSKIALAASFAFIFLGIRGVLSILHTLPESLNPIGSTKIEISNDPLWLLISIITLVAFFLLALWQWNFVRKRFFIRVIEVLLTVTILLAIFSSAIMGIMGGNIIRETNLAFVERNSELITYFFEQKLLLSSKIAEAITTRPNLMLSINNRDSEDIDDFLKNFFTEFNYTTKFKVYDTNGEIIFDPFYPEDEGQVVEDKYLEEVLSSGMAVTTVQIDTDSNLIVGRTLSPVLNNGEIISVFDVNFLYDSNYLKDIKGNTNIDILVYTNYSVIASTLDTTETIIDDDKTFDKVKNGEQVTTTVFINGSEYFANFSPIPETDGSIIGMFASIKSREVVTEYIKQQLIAAFIIITNIAFVVSIIAYIVLRRGYSKDIIE